MSGHTPGPWAIKRDTNGWPDIYSPPMPDEDCGEIEPLIVKVMPTVDGVSCTESNASLIAASPDLLKEIENIVPKETFHTSKEWEDDEGYGYEVILSVGDIKRLRSLIAKAKGGA